MSEENKTYGARYENESLRRYVEIHVWGRYVCIKSGDIPESRQVGTFVKMLPSWSKATSFAIDLGRDYRHKGFLESGVPKKPWRGELSGGRTLKTEK